MSKKCIVKDCVNETGQGAFVGDLCLPCFKIITTGKPNPTHSILNEIGDNLGQAARELGSAYHLWFYECYAHEPRDISGIRLRFQELELAYKKYLKELYA